MAVFNETIRSVGIYTTPPTHMPLPVSMSERILVDCGVNSD